MQYNQEVLLHCTAMCITPSVVLWVLFQLFSQISMDHSWVRPGILLHWGLPSPHCFRRTMVSHPYFIPNAKTLTNQTAHLTSPNDEPKFLKGETKSFPIASPCLCLWHGVLLYKYRPLLRWLYPRISNFVQSPELPQKLPYDCSARPDFTGVSIWYTIDAR